MTMIQFTNNINDRSTEAGFQFEFKCDRCHTGCMSSFKPSKMGIASGVLRATGSLFSGGAAASGALNAGKDFLRGHERDEALRLAVEEAKKQFKLCGRCGKWVCEVACWNGPRSLCKTCSPLLDEELASIQDRARATWMQRKAMSTDMLPGVDITQNSTTPTARHVCPKCSTAFAGKFCPECGSAVAQSLVCRECGAETAPGAKFCNACGTSTSG
jgi:ribosomal protein L40E